MPMTEVEQQLTTALKRLTKHYTEAVRQADERHDGLSKQVTILSAQVERLSKQVVTLTEQLQRLKK